MTRAGDTERETIRIAADSASKLLPSLHQKRAKLDGQIANLQAVIDAWESISGKRSKTDPSVQDGGTGAKIRTRVKRGQVPEHINQILQAGGAYDEPELRKAITEKFGATYSRATVYTSLRRGLKDHKYVQNGKKWSLNPLKVA
jgi:hypothetical protein